MKVNGRILFVWVLLFVGCLGGVFISLDFYTGRMSINRRGQIQQQARQLYWAIKAYSNAHGGRLPQATAWEDDVAQAAKISRSQMDQLVSCPLPRTAGATPRRFALNNAVAGQSIGRFENSPYAVLFFESSSTNRNASDALVSLAPPKVGRYLVTTCVGFTSGYINLITNMQFPGYATWAAKQIKPVAVIKNKK